MLGMVLLSGLGYSTLAQSTGAKCKPDDATCKAGSSTTVNQGQPKPAAEQFPFPAEDSKGASGKSTLPEMPTTGVPDPPAASEKPMHLPPGSSSSSSGDDDDSSPARGGTPARTAHDDDDDVTPTTADPNAPVKAAALKDLGSRGDLSAARAKLEQTRVEDDLKVGGYYLQTGNAQGAYLRYKDAAARAPDEPDARFGLAEAANKLNKREEAVLNYREYLRLDAGGDHDKPARKALLKLGGAQ